MVAKGRGTMPGFDGKISAAEQRTTLEYVRSLTLGMPPSTVATKGSGVITGTVVNGTTGQPVPNLTVSLGIFDATSLLEDRTAATDATGVYRFADLPTDATLMFATQTEYPAGVPYFSNSTKFAIGASSLNLPLAVYETTNDPAGISADRVHYIIEFANGRAFVAELLVFSLTGNRAYIGTGMGTLRFTVPAGAEDLEISDGEIGGQYVPTNDGFVDTLPVPPGQGARQVLFRYSLPYSANTLDLVRTVPYPTAAINALVTDVGAEVSSAQLVNQGVRQTATGNFINLGGRISRPTSRSRSASPSCPRQARPTRPTSRPAPLAPIARCSSSWPAWPASWPRSWPPGPCCARRPPARQRPRPAAARGWWTRWRSWRPRSRPGSCRKLPTESNGCG